MRARLANSGLGCDGDASRLAAQRDEFLGDLQASLAASTARFGLDVLPGAADRGDLDPTSSGWVASEHIRSVLDLFAYEDESERSLVLAAGVPMAWLRGKGLAIRDLGTPYGRLGWAARIEAGGAIDVRVSGLRSFPSGGVILRGPWAKSARVIVDGRIAAVPADAIVLTHLPAHIRVEPRLSRKQENADDRFR